MDRETFLPAGGAILVTVGAASSAMAVNLGILDSSSADKVGKLEIRAVAATTTTTTATAREARDPSLGRRAPREGRDDDD